MRRRLRFFGKNRKGFTLMECVCAIAIVGLLSAVLLPLTSSAIVSMKTSNELRRAAEAAAYSDATTATVVNGKNKNVETMYVTVTISEPRKKEQTDNDPAPDVIATTESAFAFLKSQETGEYNVQVTYYDLKYGKETADPEASS